MDSPAVWDVTEDIQVQPGHISNQRDCQPEISTEILNGAKLTPCHHVTITFQENTDHVQPSDQLHLVNKNVEIALVIPKIKTPTKDHQSTESHPKSLPSKPN